MRSKAYPCSREADIRKEQCDFDKTLQLYAAGKDLYKGEVPSTPSPSTRDIRYSQLPPGYSTAFQPIIETTNGRTKGYESLLRGPEGTALASPGFIFGEKSHIPDAVRLILDRMAIEAAVKNSRNLPESKLIFINVLCKTLLMLASEASEVVALFNEQNISPSRIIFELSETTDLKNTDELARSLNVFRSIGIRLALDDIGVRSPYLYHLLALAPEFMKLDRIFVKGIDISSRKQDLVGSMVTMAVRMGTMLIAEGIETENELTAVRKLGVPFAQGFFIGRPNPAFYWQQAEGKQ